MATFVAIVILNVFTLKSWGHSYELPKSEIFEIQEFNTHLKFLQNSDTFASTRVFDTGLQQYIFGLENEDVHLNVSQLITKYGHGLEEHEVKTKDGYILRLIRIPNKGPVVFLMHGLLMSADDWVLAGPESGIAYLLAKQGYDVWMGNARGNKHSRRHEKMLPSSVEFWNFSFDEIGRYDLPAMIDYVLDKTNRTKLTYVGHSQGTTAFLVMCSEMPEYNDKISLMAGLSLVGAIPKMKSPVLNLLKFITLFHPELLFGLVKEMGIHEFLPSRDLVNNFAPNICGRAHLAKIVCSNVVFLLCGFNALQLNITNLPVIFSHVPAGASTKQLEHYSQSVISGKFARFDYGEFKNFEVYGSKSPPEYQVEKVSVPVAIFYADNDWLAAPEDVDALRKRLKTVVEYYKVPHLFFNHVDFLYARDVKHLVFTKLLQVIQRY
ncbi:unnamed protein product [Chrysodeixis includens]|uniref:Lipase n=1 Tax=Chrysodeixis includens TaxID=689277 RepID=A0A9N8Q044_CHRIL|nr:unnamed protein product [Chrysodeixis includens]